MRAEVCRWHYELRVWENLKPPSPGSLVNKFFRRPYVILAGNNFGLETQL